MIFGLTSSDFVVLWRDFIQCIAWFVAIIYLISGVQDLVYDVWGYAWRIYRRYKFSNRTRLTVARLRLRDEQNLAIFVPAWQESRVIHKMVENILDRVEYHNYTIFVGTYPNDLATMQAVDAIAAKDPRVIKVVASHPGPTNKADNMNQMFRAMKAFEKCNEIYFDIIAMHDAEDYVHPYSFLVFNYLLPRVDAVQLPILPLPVSHNKWTHWTYADEFAENHLKEIMVRERMGGFVPYAGVGTGFSRRAFNILEQRGGGKIFNEGSMTEDYSLSKKMREANLNSIFVNLVLADDKSPWWVPLSMRSAFVCNWSYFPMDFVRAIRQKTRWIIGISLQEWEFTGWKGSWAMRENLIKDRKGFLSSATVFLGYSIFAYFVIYTLGSWGMLPFKWLPVIEKNSALYRLVIIDSFFMLVRLSQRIAFVSMVYGPISGLLSVLRMFYGNIINGVAAYRALRIFRGTWRGQKVAWDKTEHQEGAGDKPTEEVIVPTRGAPLEREVFCGDFLSVLTAAEIWEMIPALEALQPDCSQEERESMIEMLRKLAHNDNAQIRAVIARIIGRLLWEELTPLSFDLLIDRDWVVRSNAARAILQAPHFVDWLDLIFLQNDHFAHEVLIRSIEQDERALNTILEHLDDSNLGITRSVLLHESPFVRERYEVQLKAARYNDGRVEVGAVRDSTPECVPNA